MKRHFLPLLFGCIINVLQAQNTGIDSLKTALSGSGDDTTRVMVYSDLCKYYTYKYPDTALIYGSKGLELAEKLNFKKGEIKILSRMGEVFNTKGNYPKALEVQLRALHEAEKIHDPYLIANCHNFLGALYVKTQDYQTALSNYNKAKDDEAYFMESKKQILGAMGQCYFHLNKLDSAYYYTNQSYELDIKDQQHWSLPYYWMADIYQKKGNSARALDFLRAGNKIVSLNPDFVAGYVRMAFVFNKMGNQDSAIYYANKVLEEARRRSFYKAVLDVSSLLSDIYKSNNVIDSAFKYQEISLAAKDSLFSQDKVKLIQNLSFNELQRQQEIEQARKEALQQYASKVKLYSLLAVLLIIAIVAAMLYRNNQQKQKANTKIEKAYSDLKSTQAQLIQSEKMASLGELTAGIAHEIQNPLNFVNNFSDVNKELADELEQEIDKGNYAEAKAIAKDIKDNEEKINHHGKRADSIVKGMLQHSRSSSAQKEPTDINALCDEYLRLAYHGLRAKDKSFNATMKTDFDKSIGNINIIPQDIGRIILNLINNAFYAVDEKKKQNQNGYEPTVLVSTKKINGKVEIKVADNGNGIPQKVLDKIFQPFFTTKPTGQGTGLGLSLSYDIVKAHGGDIKVNTKEGEGAEFIVYLSL